MATGRSVPSRCVASTSRSGDLALLGPNGAGKTSTIMAIMGHATMHGGRMLFDGEDMTHCRAGELRRARRRAGARGTANVCRFEVEENLTVGGYPSLGDSRSCQTRTRLRAVPASCRTPLPDRGLDVGGRAADAGDRPCTNGGAEAVSDRRIVARPDAEDGRYLASIRC